MGCNRAVFAWNNAPRRASGWAEDLPSKGTRMTTKVMAAAVLAAGVMAGTATSAQAAVTSTLGNGVLSISGDSLDNTIAVSRDAAGTILVNGGAVVTTGGTPTVANTTKIQVFGLA